MIRIYADFNSIDEQDRVMLNTIGSLRDLEQHKEVISDGMKVVLYMTGEFEVCGTILLEDIWKGVPDWNTIRYEKPEDMPKK